MRNNKTLFKKRGRKLISSSIKYCTRFCSTHW